jgi:quercetin dioxygenase-like cupin family protein
VNTIDNPLAAVARHVGAADVPWVLNPAHPGAEMRLLQADVDARVYVTAGRLPPGLSVGIHRHTGAVHMFTLSGSWGYREHDFVNRAGSYLYEPPNSVHTLYVPTDQDVTETLSVIYGETLFLDPDGAVIARSDASTNLRLYFEACEAAALPRPNGILR